MNKTYQITSCGLFTLTFLVATALLFSNPAAKASLVDLLGPAGDYTVLGLNGNSDHMSSGPLVVNGNVGVGDNSTFQFDGGGTLNGSVYSSSSATVNDSGNHISGSPSTTTDFSAINAGVQNLANYAKSLGATQTFSSGITNAMTLQSTASVNVISVGGPGITLSGGDLTLNGSASSEFIFQINGIFHLSGNTNIVLTGGLTANNVLWDLIGSGGVQTDGKSNTSGIFLSSNGIQINGGVHNSEFIAIGGPMSFQSNPVVAQPVPEVTPSSMIFGFLGLVIAVSSRRALIDRFRGLAVHRNGRAG